MSADKEWDGVRCADNKFPGWYVISFIGTVIWGVAYLLYFHVFTDWSQAGQFAEEVTYYEQTYKGASSGSPVEAGKKTFAATCAACHGQDAKGMIGPDLTDAEWLHGATEADLIDVITNGRADDQIKQNPNKGPMPGHKGSLGEGKIREVVSYLKSINSSIK